MLRASAVSEQAGLPTSTLVCEGFLELAAAASVGQGMPNLPVAMVPGHTGVQSKEVLRRNILEVTLEEIINNLVGAPEAAIGVTDPPARHAVLTGTYDEVNDYFADHKLSDGLPIVPPTRDRIDAFLKHTDSAPETVLGILLPDMRQATIWSVAVNGVMAGCKPEYMPILVALVEAMCDPYYGVEHSGNTPGAETQIILNGPLIKELNFNYSQGAMRDGFRPNSTIGRFWRLYLRNIPGFLPHGNDKATYGNTWRVVVAENEDVVEEIGWEPLSVEMGFRKGANTVTIARYTGGNHISSVSGSRPEEMVPYLAEAMVQQNTCRLAFTVGDRSGTLRPLLLLSPILARSIAKAGWSKADLCKAIHEKARMPAWQMERFLRDWMVKPQWNLANEVRFNRLPKVYFESEDPNRLVPIVWDAEDYMVVVTGDPARNSVYILAHNGVLGYPTAKEIRLPADWARLRSGSSTH